MFADNSGADFPPITGDIAAVSSLVEARVRRAYDGLEDVNRYAIKAFDNTMPPTWLRLTPGFYEGEDTDAAAVVADARRDMLGNLGITAPDLETKTDANILAAFAPPDAPHQQLRRIMRPRKPPTHALTLSLPTQDGGSDIFAVCMLNPSDARKEQRRLEELGEYANIEERLEGEFGFSRSFLTISNLPLDQMRRLVRAHDELRADALFYSSQDVFQAARHKLVSHLVPLSPIIRGMQRSRIYDGTEKHTARYLQQVTSWLDANNASDETKRKVIENEQLLRLSSLNKQLDRQRRVLKVGMAASTVVTAGASTALGSTLGLMTGVVSDTTPNNYVNSDLEYARQYIKWAIGGAATGLAFGLGVRYEKIARLIHRGAFRGDFIGLALYGERRTDVIEKQLEQEKAIAARYKWATNTKE